jgi:hypothetical protein
VAQLPPAIALRLQGKGSYAVALVVIEELLAEKDAQEARHAVEVAALRGRIAESPSGNFIALWQAWRSDRRC